jgi:hypothetical protein
VVSFTTLPFKPREKSPRYALDRKLDGSQNRSGRRGEKKIFDPTGTRNSDPSVIQPVGSRYTDCAIRAPGSDNNKSNELSSSIEGGEFVANPLATQERVTFMELKYIVGCVLGCQDLLQNWTLYLLARRRCKNNRRF